MSPKCYIGTSGWHYDHWRGVFYPRELAKDNWLGFYSHQFNSVEINNSFYRLPRESTIENWQAEVSPDFCFAIKVSRFITHIKRLKDSQDPMHTFNNRVNHLGSNLGPLLYQLPPTLQRDDERLEMFLRLLDNKLHHVFEFRHPSWMNVTTYTLLEKYNAGFCVYDMTGFTSPLVSTNDLTYMRFHGHESLYSSHYSDAELTTWAEKLNKLASKLKDLYVYFNNDAGGFAVENALTLRKFLEGK